MIPPCSICASHHCLQSCPGPLPSQRPGAPRPAAPEVIPEANRHAIRRDCLTHLAELDAEATTPLPDPDRLRLLASLVDRTAPQMPRALLRLTLVLAALLECRPDWENDFRYPQMAAMLGVRVLRASSRLRLELERLACGPGGGSGG